MTATAKVRCPSSRPALAKRKSKRFQRCISPATAQSTQDAPLEVGTRRKAKRSGIPKEKGEKKLHSSGENAENATESGTEKVSVVVPFSKASSQQLEEEKKDNESKSTEIMSFDDLGRAVLASRKALQSRSTELLEASQKGSSIIKTRTFQIVDVLKKR